MTDFCGHSIIGLACALDAGHDGDHKYAPPGTPEGMNQVREMRAMFDASADDPDRHTRAVIRPCGARAPTGEVCYLPEHHSKAHHYR